MLYYASSVISMEMETLGGLVKYQNVRGLLHFQQQSNALWKQCISFCALKFRQGWRSHYKIQLCIVYSNLYSTFNPARCSSAVDLHYSGTRLSLTPPLTSPQSQFAHMSDRGASSNQQPRAYRVFDLPLTALFNTTSLSYLALSWLHAR